MPLSRTLVAAAAAVVVLGGCGGLAADAIGQVGDVPITVDDVEALVPAEDLVVTAGTTSDARARDAVELAVRDVLLAEEARRRGLTGESRSHVLDQLVVQERATQPSLQPASITDGEARTWYGERRHLFAPVARATAVYTRHTDADEALAAFEEADASARALAAEDGMVVLGDGTEPPEVVERIVNAVRREGAVGMDVDPATGEFWLVRVDDITFEDLDWDEALATRVRTAMLWEREQEHLADLAARVADGTEVEIDEARVQAYVASLERRG